MAEMILGLIIGVVLGQVIGVLYAEMKQYKEKAERLERRERKKGDSEYRKWLKENSLERVC